VDRETDAAMGVSIDKIVERDPVIDLPANAPVAEPVAVRGNAERLEGSPCSAPGPRAGRPKHSSGLFVAPFLSVCLFLTIRSRKIDPKIADRHMGMQYDSAVMTALSEKTKKPEQSRWRTSRVGLAYPRSRISGAQNRACLWCARDAGKGYGRFRRTRLRPNLLARGLVQNRPQTVGVVVLELSTLSLSPCSAP